MSRRRLFRLTQLIPCSSNISRQISLTRASFSPEIRVYRPRNPHLQSPLGLVLQHASQSTPHKRHREPSNPDPDSDSDQDLTSDRSPKRSSNRIPQEPQERISPAVRKQRDFGLRMARMKAERMAAEIAAERVEAEKVAAESMEMAAESLAVELRDGLAEGVRGRDAAGREVRGDGSLAGGRRNSLFH